MKKNDNLRLLKPGSYIQLDVNRMVKLENYTPCLLIKTEDDPCLVVFAEGKRLVAWESNMVDDKAS